MIEYYIYIIIFVFCLILSGFFSGSEVALFTITRAKVRTLVNEKSQGSEALATLKKTPDKFLITILVGNNVVNILAASVATAVSIGFFGETGIAVSVATIVVVLLLLVFGEILPKMYATRNATEYALRFSPAILLLSRILSPITYVFNALAGKVTGSIGFAHHMITEEEIKEWIDVGQEEGTIEKNEQEMLHSVFEFSDTRVREVMTPRIDVVMIEDSASPEEALEIFKTTGFSRLPVWHENIDTIRGVLNVKDVIFSVLNAQDTTPVEEICSEPLFVPETKNIDDLLKELRVKKTHMAIVLDEYGSFVGIVTVEDILEELVGDILDEFDTEEHELVRIADNVYSVNARMWVEDLNKELGISLPMSETYETIAGLFIERMGNIPRIGDVCDITEENIRLVVIQMTGKRINRLKLLLNSPHKPESGQGENR
ncbi:hemolysin family protein [Methanospirillum stamsii]|uniref:HlyC/CorC family transporter n=1 Tax=Methanospirillum stamsii TaxID=1277351 RepID=A0A2V2NI64_9EURY|nr:hemolysin family protein [Methanospirillum stamsii]PWR76107.1 HlyC/CorC family transporter [Methanospirillum stamsii]